MSLNACAWRVLTGGPQPPVSRWLIHGVANLTGVCGLANDAVLDHYMCAAYWRKLLTGGKYSTRSCINHQLQWLLAAVSA